MERHSPILSTASIEVYTCQFNIPILNKLILFSFILATVGHGNIFLIFEDDHCSNVPTCFRNMKDRLIPDIKNENT